MKQTLRVFSAALAPFVCLFATATAAAQVPSPAPSPTPDAPAARLTPIDQEYDGRLHITVAPYIWAPTIKQNVQYTLPTIRRPGGGGGGGGGVPIQASVEVGPSDYLAKINAAAMFAFDARQGDTDLFGDIIYTNVSTSAAFSTLITGPLGKVKIPATLSTDSRLSDAIWELGAGVTVARGHDADLSLFAGWREFPITLHLSYNARVGRKRVLAPSGSLVVSDRTDDVIFGFRGKAFFGDGHFYIPYYIDDGVGANNQSWEGYTGAGYAFDHGQTLIFVYRSLNYNAFPPSAHVQKLTFNGPLLGYTFHI